MEERKILERDYHNLKRDDTGDSEQYREYVQKQKKWYSIVERSERSRQNWLAENCQEKAVLDYGTGNGNSAIAIAKMGAKKVTGIDLSDLSVDNARKCADAEGVGDRVEFHTMDAENTDFADSSFQVIHESGVLHHLDLDKAYAEMSRILSSDGKAVCIEALGHNPVIQRYRRKTPQLRTEWEVEHILRRPDINKAKKYFKNVKVLGFFHLASIAAVPFRNKSYFKPFCRFFDAVDSVLLKLPLIKWQAWQVIFILSNPIKK